MLVWNARTFEPLFNIRGHGGRIFCSVRRWVVEKDGAANASPPTKASNDAQAATVQKQRKQTQRKQAARNAAAPSKPSAAPPQETAAYEAAPPKLAAAPAPEAASYEGVISAATKGASATATKTLLPDLFAGAGVAALLGQLLSVPCPGEDRGGGGGVRGVGELVGLSDAALSEADLVGVIRRAATAKALEGDGSKGTALALWGGDVARDIAEAAAAKRLTAEHVAVAPSAGMDVWAAASRLFAAQLEAERKPHKAVSFLLAAHQAPLLPIIPHFNLIGQASCPSSPIVIAI
ncbi:hypothetical protein T484DRAFT_1812264 [Baffinella frigidus]|nr:hypothetical protein T484DRAFT_1812264 [Cryptophyta sp. CCMP2293]